MKLSYSEFDVGDGGRGYLRDQFLRHVSKVPIIIEELRMILNYPQQFPLGYGHLWQAENDRLRGFLINWSKTRHMDADWVRERVFEKLCQWADLPEEDRIMDLGDAAWGASAAHSPPEGLPTYYPTRIKRARAVYLDSVRSDVRLKLKQEGLQNLGDAESFVESVVREAELYCQACEEGLPSPRTKQDLDRDIDWAVRYQVKEEEFADIALRERKGKQADAVLIKPQIKKAVYRMLRDLGLTARNRPGRPKVSKKRSPSISC